MNKQGESFKYYFFKNPKKKHGNKNCIPKCFKLSNKKINTLKKSRRMYSLLSDSYEKENVISSILFKS